MHESLKSSTQPRRRRWLIALALLLAVFQAGAAWRALTVPADLATQISLPLSLEVLASATWAVAAALVALGLLHRHPRAGAYTAWLVIGFTGYSLARLAVFVRADYDRQRLPFLVVATIVVVMVPVAYLIRFRLTEKVTHGRKPED
ncbi:MAG: hypothetical protein HZC41_18880 [Chloroflexi bacterium]|nr:hypothetical protein [Chloroflexota bacterium]